MEDWSLFSVNDCREADWLLPSVSLKDNYRNGCIYITHFSAHKNHKLERNNLCTEQFPGNVSHSNAGKIWTKLNTSFMNVDMPLKLASHTICKQSHRRTLYIIQLWLFFLKEMSTKYSSFIHFMLTLCNISKFKHLLIAYG